MHILNFVGCPLCVIIKSETVAGEIQTHKNLISFDAY